MKFFPASYPPVEGLAVGQTALYLFAVTVELLPLKESRTFVVRASSPREARDITYPLVKHWKLEKQKRLEIEEETARLTKTDINISDVLTEQFLDHPDEPGMLSVVDVEWTTFAEDQKNDTQ